MITISLNDQAAIETLSEISLAAAAAELRAARWTERQNRLMALHESQRAERLSNIAKAIECVLYGQPRTRDNCHRPMAPGD